MHAMVDWKTQLQPDSRHQIVNIMIITLKKHQKFSGPEVLHELKTIAEKFEEEIYTAATSELDYISKIWLKMQTIETASQNRKPNQVGNSNRPPDQASLDSAAQNGLADEGDWQEEIYQKIKLMKEQYLPELNEMNHKLATKLEQLDSLPNPPKPDLIEKLKLFRSMIERATTFLQIQKAGIKPGYKDKIAHYERQIIDFIKTNRPSKPNTEIHQMQQTQSETNQVQQSHGNHSNEAAKLGGAPN